MASPAHHPKLASVGKEVPVYWEQLPSFLRIASNFLLIGAAAFLALLLLVAPEQLWTVRGVGVALLGLMAAIGRLMAWHGMYKSGALMLVAGTWLYVTVVAFFTGGLHANTILIYPPIIMLTGWRLGPAAGRVVAGLSVAACIGFYWAGLRGVLPHSPPTPVALLLLVEVFVFMFSAALVTALTHSYRERLDEVTKLGHDLAQRSADLNRAQRVAHIGSWTYDIAADRFHPSAETCRLFGIPAGTQASYKEFLGAVHPDDHAAVLEASQAALAGNPSFTIEHRLLIGKTLRWVCQLAELELDPDGRPVSALGTTQDITERKEAEAALIESRNLLQSIIDTAPLRVFWKDRELRYMGCNPAFAVDAGMAGPKDLIGKEDYQLAWADRADLYRADDHAVMASGCSKLSYEQQATRADGRTAWLRTSKVPLKSGAGETIGVLGIYQDITADKQTEEKLHLAASVFTHAKEGIMILAADGNILDVNQAFVEITGYTREEVIGRAPSLLGSEGQGEEFFAVMWRQLTQNGQWQGEVWNRRKNGQAYAVMQTISAVRDAQGRPREYVALFSDITVLKEHERQLEHIAHYDALTTLPNRVLLGDRLQQAMAQTQRRGQRLAVAYIDLDGFKAVNDKHGHEAGDHLLTTVAARMKQALREGDTLARLGGDEFVAVMLDLAEVNTSVPLLDRLLAAAAEPMNVDELTLQVSASVGVTFYPQFDEVDADQLLRQADQAMYQAKLAGKNRYHVFDAEQDSSIRGHHESLDRIRRALAMREFVLYYQPKVDMRSGRIIGAEALIRWKHPEKGVLLPAVFLPVIEDHPLAVEIGEWVIDTALAQMEQWQAAGLDIPVSVNVGARQLQQAAFIDRLRALLAAHPRLKPDSLELEVLETSALGDLAQVSEVIDACRDIGVKFSLDDFGTGYSSLTYLKRLPVTQLKIDQSFVRDMLDDPDDLAILEGVVSLATAFSREVIAEGVETLEHGEMLLQMGCQLAQGYGIARPMPAADLPAWSAAWRPEPSWVKLPLVSRDDLPLLFASVEHRAWILAMGFFLKGERDAPPQLDYHKCRFGAWLDTEGRTHHGGLAAFQDIDLLHHRVHDLATELLALKARGQTATALARLDELHGLRDELLDQLKNMVLHHPH